MILCCMNEYYVGNQIKYLFEVQMCYLRRHALRWQLTWSFSCWGVGLFTLLTVACVYVATIFPQMGRNDFCCAQIVQTEAIGNKTSNSIRFPKIWPQDKNGYSGYAWKTSNTQKALDCVHNISLMEKGQWILTLEDEFLIVVMWLKIGLFQKDLAHRFGMSEATNLQSL